MTLQRVQVVERPSVSVPVKTINSLQTHQLVLLFLLHLLLLQCDIDTIISFCLQAFSSDMTGAMTSTFIRAVKGAIMNKRKISYREILDYMHQSLKKDDKVGCGFRRVFQRKILQVLLNVPFFLCIT